MLCTAHTVPSVEQSARPEHARKHTFNVRTWLIAFRRQGDVPEAILNPACPGRDFELEWDPQVGLTLFGFDPKSILSAILHNGFVDNHPYASFFEPGPLRLELFDESSVLGQMVAWTAQFQMMSPEFDGCHALPCVGAHGSMHERCAEVEHEPVTQEVDHDSDPEPVLSREAGAVEHELWASAVEGRLLGIIQPATADLHQRQVVVLKFSRYTGKLNSAVLTSNVACRLMADGHDVEPSWARGAKVLVAGLLPEHLDDAASLRAWHVIITQDQEEEFIQELQDLSYTTRKLNQGDRRHVVPGTFSLCNFSENDNEGYNEDGAVQLIEYHVEVVNTFIYFTEPLDNRTVRTV